MTSEEIRERLEQEADNVCTAIDVTRDLVTKTPGQWKHLVTSYAILIDKLISIKYELEQDDE
jgi:hypothetical protein